MKRLLLGLVVAFSLLAPSPAGAAEYATFVGCDDLAETPTPSNVCMVDDFPAAYFEADVDTEYEIRVEFPSGKTLCLEEQFAEAEVLYLNSITSEVPGTMSSPGTSKASRSGPGPSDSTCPPRHLHRWLQRR